MFVGSVGPSTMPATKFVFASPKDNPVCVITNTSLIQTVITPFVVSRKNSIL
jgi:hypothetical protein